MRVLLDFRCDNGHITERFIDSETKEIPCPECSLMARKVISPIRSQLDPHCGDFIGATTKWARNREKQIQKERRDNS